MDIPAPFDAFQGDDLTVSFASASFLGPDVAANKLVTVNDLTISGGADLNNYRLGNTANITPAGQTITVTTAALLSASEGSSFKIAATASSGLSVAMTASGACSGSGKETVSITMSSGFGTCCLVFTQPGNLNFAAADPI